MEDFKGFVSFVAFVLVVVVVIVLIVAIPVTYLNYVSCQQWAAWNPQLQFQWHWLNGCAVRLDNGVYINASDYAKFYKDITVH